MLARTLGTKLSPRPQRSYNARDFSPLLRVDFVHDLIEILHSTLLNLFFICQLVCKLPFRIVSWTIC